MRFAKWAVIIALMVFLWADNGGALAGEECKDHGESGGHEGELSEVVVSKASQELISVKTAKAKLESFVKKISVVGQVAQDVEDTVSVVGPGSGEVVDCKAPIGAIVKKDDVLCTVKMSGAGSITEVRSPISGMVIGGSAKPGEKVDTVSSLHTIADFSVLQATFDVYEKDIRHVKLGQGICIRSVAYPDKCFDGQITFISPRVDPQTNAIKVRADIRNPEYLLKLGMFAAAEISVESAKEYIVVPIEAVHSSGDKNIIFIKTGPEKFEAREVTVSERSASQAAISSGIREGEEIVVENSFLLKSELLKSQMGAGCAE